MYGIWQHTFAYMKKMNEIPSSHTVRTILYIHIRSMCTAHTSIWRVKTRSCVAKSFQIELRQKKYLHQPITQHVLCFVISQESICVCVMFIYKCVVIVSEPGCCVPKARRALSFYATTRLLQVGPFIYIVKHCCSIVKSKILAK